MNRYFTLRILLFAIVLSAALLSAQSSKKEATPKPLMGFMSERLQDQYKWENLFDSYLHPDSLKSWMQTLTARPHHAGSPYDSLNALFISEKFKSWGFDTKIEEFYVLFPTPKTRLLDMVSPEEFVATLEEPPLKEDATSGPTNEQLPIYNCYSIDGEVTGELVYVNYGVPRDYEELEKAGVDVKGKIVIAKYGGSWRGIKPKAAAERGAIGCIIYSDPKEDGYYQGDDYPKGGYRNSSGAQRGSVADMPLYSGDPLTPFVGATKDAVRLKKEEAATLTKIPVIPISYGDALPLLRNLGGQVVPESWRGALPVTYHFGPGPAKVHLKLAFNWNIVPIRNVIATLKGTTYPDEWILRGNHHDAWVNGAEDPISGMVATMAEGQALGKLIKKGWKPLRTITYCAWDAEEQGLLGSTEWVETHLDEIRSKTVVYINSDGNGRGFLFMGGSHSLEKFINQVARDVTDPQLKIPVHERAKALRIVNSSPEDAKEVK
ncbi:MAG: M28 family peptidase, partial [Bacteroidetes bacterium]